MLFAIKFNIDLNCNAAGLQLVLFSHLLFFRHNLEGDVRHSLYDAADAWTNAVKKRGSRFLGGDQPNLADVTVYGVLSSIEGCQAFQDLRNNTDIGKWYDEMRDNIASKKGRVLAFHAMN